jgi:MinD-like ATPase involved in chromosome partitioning or flagellar assembly
MSGITTITSGLDQVGKTHLGINIALELTRIGHSVAYYHEGGGQGSLSYLLQLRQRSTPKTQDRKTGVTCHGYQGVDVLTSRIPLSHWNALERDELAALVSAHEVWSGYDDMVIDTSGMSPRAVIACCRQSGLVLLVVTPDQRSQAGAFALLRILRLNTCATPVLLIVNRVENDGQAASIHALFSDKARRYLDLEVPLLAAVNSDEHVHFASRHRQAFTSMFPETPVSACIVNLVEQLQTGESVEREPSGVPGFWKEVAGSLRLDMRLPGNTALADYEQSDEPGRDETTRAGSDDSQPEATLLRFEGPLARLGSVMEKFSGVIHSLADDMQAFHDRLEDVHSDACRTVEWSEPDAAVLEVTLAAILDTLRQCVSRRQQVCFQVEEDPVGGQETGWLAAGYYIKYVLVLPPGQEDIINNVRREMERVPGLRLSKGQDGECICEAISQASDACLGVIHTPQGEIRINYWHRPDRRKSLRLREAVKDVPSGRGPDRQPVNKLLH